MPASAGAPLALIWSIARLSLTSCRRGQRWMPCRRQARCAHPHMVQPRLTAAQGGAFVRDSRKRHAGRDRQATRLQLQDLISAICESRSTRLSYIVAKTLAQAYGLSPLPCRIRCPKSAMTDIRIGKRFTARTQAPTLCCCAAPPEQAPRAGPARPSARLERGGADAQAVGGLLEPHAKLALQVLQPQPLARLAGVARPAPAPPPYAARPRAAQLPHAAAVSWHR